MNARDELRKYANLLADSWTPRSKTDDRVEWLYGLVRAEVIAERDAEIMRWLGKKAREYRATGSKQDELRADTCTVLASKISRGAVRSNNVRLPAGVEPLFFEPGRTYTENAPFRAPEDRPNFRCIAIAQHPTKGSRRAFGFEQSGAGAPWVSSSMRDEEWADGWVEVPEAGEASA